MKKLTIAIVILLLFVPSLCFATDGQSYAMFDTYYADNISLINDSTGRHLLPKEFTIDKQSDGTTSYTISEDYLSVEITVDSTDAILNCTIKLIAPSGMEYGNSVYNEFSIPAYHSYALLMAMSLETQAIDRYSLVTQIEQGLQENPQAYVVNVGQYQLACTKDGNSVEMVFINSATITPEPTSTPNLDDTTQDTNQNEDENQEDYIG